jgi:hypothetical protein
MLNNWRCIPVRPTADEAWFILDSSRDYKTVWGPPARRGGMRMSRQQRRQFERTSREA